MPKLQRKIKGATPLFLFVATRSDPKFCESTTDTKSLREASKKIKILENNVKTIGVTPIVRCNCFENPLILFAV